MRRTHTSDVRALGGVANLGASRRFSTSRVGVRLLLGFISTARAVGHWTSANASWPAPEQSHRGMTCAEHSMVSERQPPECFGSRL